MTLRLITSILIYLLLSIPVCFASGVAKQAVSVPEVEIERGLTTLKNIDHQVSTLEVLNSEHSARAVMLAAKRSFMNAQKYFAQEMYLAAIRESLAYQKLSQSPETSDYMKSLYTLGRSYQEIGMDIQALQAYLRYVAIHTTVEKPDNPQLLRVLHYAIPLATNHSTITNQDLKKLFSAVVGISMTKTQKAELLYYAANSARESGEVNIASEWFERSAAMSADPNLTARSRYFHALLLLGQRNFQAAKKILLENVSKNSGPSKEFAEYSLLALARINMTTKNTSEALSYYRQISEESSLYKDALFESIYAYVELKDGSRARSGAEKFLKIFPSDNRVFQLKSLMSYFYLKDGKWDLAKSSMNDADEQLSRYRQWIDQTYAKSSEISQRDIDNLFKLSNGQILHSPDAVLGHKLYSKLAELSRRISDSRANLRNLIYTLGRTNLKQFKPSWINRSKQYEHLSEKALVVGHRLIFSMQNAIKDSLSDLEKNSLEISRKRRFDLFSAPSKMKRRKEIWANWSNALDLTKDIAQKQDRLRRLHAERSAAQLFFSNSESIDDVKRAKLKSVERSISKLEEYLARSLEVIRTSKVMEIVKQSPHRAAKTLHARYANLLNEEYLIIDRFMQDKRDSPVFVTYMSFAKAWKRWEYVNRKLYENIVAFDGYAKKHLKTNIDRIQSLISRHDALHARQQILLSKLGEAMREGIKPMVQFYHDKLDQQMANTQKWQADLEWLQYEKVSLNKEREDKRYQLEQQILKDSLQNIEQGVLWQPR